MSRDRCRLRYEDLRSFGLAQLPKSALLSSARWTARVEWPETGRSQGGATLDIDKARDGELSVEYRCGDCAIKERVLLAFEPRHFGGARTYLRCPACGERCTTLYIAGPVMRCRRCIGTLYRVIYASQGTNADGRALRRFIKLRARIHPGTERANLMYFPDRPKGMRQTTYARIKADALDALDRYRGALNARLAPKLTLMLDRMSDKSAQASRGAGDARRG